MTAQRVQQDRFELAPAGERLPDRTVRPRVTIAGVPVHAMIVPFPIACFTGALLTDIAYAQSAQVQWANFSAWLLAIGTATGALAALFGLIDLLSQRRAPVPRIAWFHMAGNLVLLALALVNNFVHARDGWTAVVPSGLALSAASVAIMVVTGFLGHRLAYGDVVRGEAR